MIVTELT